MKQIKKYNQCLRDPNPQIRINTIYYYAKQAGVKLPHTSQYAPFTHGAQTAQTADFTHTSQYAPFTHSAQTAQTAQTTVVERSPIKAVFSVKQLIRYYSSLSGIICYYPALSGNRYSKKQYLCTRNRAGTLGDKQNLTSCSSRAQTQFLRSLSVHSPFDLRSSSVFSPFSNGK